MPDCSHPLPAPRPPSGVGAQKRQMMAMWKQPNDRVLQLRWVSWEQPPPTVQSVLEDCCEAAMTFPRCTREVEPLDEARTECWSVSTLVNGSWDSSFCLLTRLCL
ncbi:hypothetical protein LEMLEM_LOCUS18868 [Lemmus lemmus]